MNWFYWMYWNPASAVFFGSVFCAIAGLTVWGVRKPDPGRKGFLPIETTRGDRLFIGVISSIVVVLLWIAFFGKAILFIPLIVSAAWFTVEALWG
jgi:predicted small integral membrane protein